MTPEQIKKHEPMNINNLYEAVPDGFFEIPDFDGMYHINKYGDVYSVRCNKILKWQKNQQGYCFVNLTKNKSVKLNLIHRLVAKTFILNPKNLPEVNHIDGIKSNN